MVLRFGILVCSDRSSRGERPDATGPALVVELQSMKHRLVRHAVLPDDLPMISRTLVDWADCGEMDIILTAGGTGFSPRDVAPEAVLSVVDRLAPGLAEAMRLASLRVTPHAMLSRSVAGIRGRVLIVNLPGSPQAAVENFRVILPVLPHAVELLQETADSEAHHSSPGD